MKHLVFINLFIFLIILNFNLLALQKKLSFITLSDLHGQLTPMKLKTMDNNIIEVGGAELLTSYIKIINEHLQQESIILDGGDVLQGTLESNLTEGEAVIRFYNYLKVKALAIGNHEFDYGPIGLDDYLNQNLDVRGTLKQRAKQANFPFLSINIKSNENWYKPSTIINYQNTKIGIIGLSSIKTPTSTFKKYISGLKFITDFQTLANIIKQESQKLFKDGANFLVLLAHEGGSCENNSIEAIEDISTCSGEIFELIKLLPKDLFNLIVTGHSHSIILKKINNTLITQSFALSTAFAWSIFNFDENLNKYIISSYKIVNTCGNVIKINDIYTCAPNLVKKYQGPIYPAIFLNKTIAKDNEIKNLLKDVFELAENKKKESSLSKAKDTFEKRHFEESSLGNLIADLLYLRYKDKVDFAIINNGGIRSNINKGEILYGDIFNMMPFDNKPAIIEIKGKIIKDLIYLSTSKVHGALSFSNLRFIMQNNNLVEVKLNNTNINDNKIYKILANDYLVSGGSGFAKIKIIKSTILYKEPFLRDIIFEELKKLKTELDPKNYYSETNKRQILL